MTIWKFQLPISDDPVATSMPMGAVARHVGPAPGQADLVYLWAEVDPARPEVNRNFIIKGTGHTYGPRLKYVGTAQTEIGLVWHVFEVGE